MTRLLNVFLIIDIYKFHKKNVASFWDRSQDLSVLTDLKGEYLCII